jgi:response regulator RpfG family c-di-GMP phosphodiesterase
MAKSEKISILIDDEADRELITETLSRDYTVNILSDSSHLEAKSRGNSIAIISIKQLYRAIKLHPKITDQIDFIAIVPSDESSYSIKKVYSLGVMEILRKPLLCYETLTRVASVTTMKQIDKELLRTTQQLDRITRIGDKQQSELRRLNLELDSYKNSLQNRVKEATKEIKSLYDEIEHTQKELIFTMGEIGESRSRETGNHVKRVAEYSYLLAIESGLSETEAEILRQASPMHDIGKVGIPDRILNKPSRLTPDEFEVMKEHSKLGYEMLKHSNRKLIKTAAIVAHQHHEKWDGTGYPRKLKGEDIHIYGRITAVADVFDALGSDRSYKKAWSDDRIIQHFVKLKGSHFDPTLVDLFLKNLNQIFKIREQFRDFH